MSAASSVHSALQAVIASLQARQEEAALDIVHDMLAPLVGATRAPALFPPGTLDALADIIAGDRHSGMAAVALGALVAVTRGCNAGAARQVMRHDRIRRCLGVACIAQRMRPCIANRWRACV